MIDEAFILNLPMQIYFLDKGLELDALLITHSGSAHEKLMGIITRWDIITIQ